MSGQMAELIIYFKARLVYLKLFSHMQCSLEFLPKGTCKDLLVRLSGTLNSFSLMQSLRDVWLSSCASRKTNRPANSWFRESSCSASLSLNPDSSPALTKQSISRSEKESVVFYKGERTLLNNNMTWFSQHSADMWKPHIWLLCVLVMNLCSCKSDEKNKIK